MTRGPYKAKPEPGSFADLIAKYRVSPRVRGWAASTSRKNDKILSGFNAVNGRAMVADLRRGDLIVMRDSMGDTPGEANNWMKVIRGLLDYAVDIEMIPHSPAHKMPKLKMPNPDGFRTWREDEIAAFELFYEVGDLPLTVFRLALYTGAARADLVHLGWPNVQGDRIRYRRRKTKSWVGVKILPPLAEVLATIPPTQITFLETRAGTVRSDKGLTGDFQRWVNAAGLGERNEYGKQLCLHGLRKALGRRIVEAGGTVHGVMSVLGHEDPKQAATYAKSYDRERTADDAMALLGGDAPETNVTRLRRPKE